MSTRSTVSALRRWAGRALSLVVLLVVWSVVTAADLVQPRS